MLDTFLAYSSRFIPFLFVVALVLLSLTLLNWLLKKRWQHQQDTRFRFQLTMLAFSMVGLLTVIMALPIGDTLRGQLLGLIGILLSAAIALSSTTFIGNILAGIMLRVIKSAGPGDFITVMDMTGRVTEMGLLHTEVQTEDRDLLTLPNLYLATQPMKVVHASGTIVSAEVSLGYDIPRVDINRLLCQAAEDAGLTDAYVQVRELGDFSVLYRVAGLLQEVTGLISARSKLRAAMLDSLHEAGVEIVSPNFMNTRSLDKRQQFIPQQRKGNQSVDEILPEHIAFDKAEAAASLEQLRQSIADIDTELSKLTDSTNKHVDKRVMLLQKEKERLLDDLASAQQET